MELTELADCSGVGDVLKQIGDKWTVQVVVILHNQPRRFSELRRSVSGISQQMLTRTLKMLERDGMLTRTVRDTTPPQVEYALTDLGFSLSKPIRELAVWAIDHRDEIKSHRSRYDAQRASKPRTGTSALP